MLEICLDVGDCIDDLHQVMEILRECGYYEMSDRLRTIVGRLSKVVPEVVCSEKAIRNISRTYK